MTPGRTKLDSPALEEKSQCGQSAYGWALYFQEDSLQIVPDVGDKVIDLECVGEEGVRGWHGNTGFQGTAETNGLKQDIVTLETFQYHLMVESRR